MRPVLVRGPPLECAIPLVIQGEDKRLPRHHETGAVQHTFCHVYRTMLLTICSDYPGLPDPRTLTTTEIRFFYEGLRESLKHLSKKK